jgi:Zn ribbon nucleic-acid-binding protein
MKITAKKDECPDCKSSDMVMAMQTGNIRVYGCLNCRNAQGMHPKISDAKKAWKAYKERVLASEKAGVNAEA